MRPPRTHLRLRRQSRLVQRRFQVVFSRQGITCQNRLILQPPAVRARRRRCTGSDRANPAVSFPASAVSGHPLLRAASESAARGARFPTLIAGQASKFQALLLTTLCRNSIELHCYLMLESFLGSSTRESLESMNIVRRAALVTMKNNSFLYEGGTPLFGYE